MIIPQQPPGWMTQPLEVVFGELGISQYLDAFLDQGFDSWETILDITESDLDVLGVKLGHRRKLQRRIANSRGVAPDASLVSPTQASIEDPRLDALRPDGPRAESRENTTLAVAKRKYRRHPKPDENAPQRPPSAYVLFSNKMRDELKGRNLTFTEIAKLVGEHWQNLSQADKKSLESQAQEAKDKYNNDLADYKKTAGYKKYSIYLQEFKAKHAHQSQDKESAKRLRLSESRGGSQSGVTNGSTNRTSRARSGSASEGEPGSEPAAGRRRRIGSTASARESQSVATPASCYTSVDESIPSPSSHGPDRRSAERSPVVNSSPRDLASIAHLRSSWLEDTRNDQIGMQHHLPPLSNMFDQQNRPSSAGHSSEVNGFAFPQTPSLALGSLDPPPPLVGGESRPQALKKEQSWATSSSSGSSSFGHPRTPIEGPLAIHTLLSTTPDQQHETMSLFYGNSTPSDQKSSLLEQRGVATSMPYANEFKPGPSPTLQKPPPPHRSAAGGYSSQSNTKPGEKKPAPNLDGMSALLRAGEIVDQRRTR